MAAAFGGNVPGWVGVSQVTTGSVMGTWPPPRILTPGAALSNITSMVGLKATRHARRANQIATGRVLNPLSAKAYATLSTTQQAANAFSR